MTLPPAAKLPCSWIISGACAFAEVSNAVANIQNAMN
jgi:hypothetical protein